MARGDEFNHAAAVAKYDIVSSPKKMVVAETKKPAQPPKQPEKAKDYGSWGPTFKNKQHFVNMHIC